MQLLAELKRRNVIRMAGLYLVGAWLLTQIASTVLPMFGAPDWLPRSVVILLALGFIPTLIFAWVFELTPDGIKRDAQVKPEESIAPQTAQRLNRAIIAVLIVALIYFGVDKFVLAPRREAAPAAGTTQAAVGPTAPQPDASISSKSIAVLPFTDLSPGHDQEYFSDGMSEEILNALAQVSDLKVAGRTSSFSFKGRNEDLRTVGRLLGVANVLEGSVRKQGDKVRITAQLIHVVDGFHLWSQAYDGDLQDVFRLQENIARAITDQLKIALIGEQKTQLVPVATRDTEAYGLYLQARAAYRERSAGVQRSVDLYRAALQRDPEFALAWAGLCGSLNVLPYYLPQSDIARVPQIQSEAEAAGKRAIELAPDLAAPHIMLGGLFSNEWRWKEAEQQFERARTLAPADPEYFFALTDWLGAMGRSEDALKSAERAVALDPMAPSYRNLYGYLLRYNGRIAESIAQLEAGYALSPTILFINQNLFSAYISAGRIDDARKMVQSIHDVLVARGESPEVVASRISMFDTVVRIARSPDQYESLRKPFGPAGAVMALSFPSHIDDLFAFVGDGIEKHEGGTDWVVALRSPWFGKYREDPRYQRLLDKAGFDNAGNPR